MKNIYIILIASLISLPVMANNCKLDLKSSFFQDLKGETEPVLGTDKFEIVYEKYSKFGPDYPLYAGYNFPFKGDCSDINFTKVEIYRELGPIKLHSAKDISSKWDKKPVFSGKKEISIKDQVITLKNFNVNQILEEAPADRHVWRFKFVFKYQNKSEGEKSFEKIIESPLVH